MKMPTDRDMRVIAMRAHGMHHIDVTFESVSDTDPLILEWTFNKVAHENDLAIGQVFRLTVHKY
jgi:hypothetical protein